MTATTRTNQEQLRLLLIEDNEIDQEILTRAFRKAEVPCEILLARDGGRAIDLMLGHDEEQSLERPYLVILDLDMPDVDGLEFLSEIRTDPQLRGTVIFVLTGALREGALNRCYDQCVAGVLYKSALSDDPAAFVHLLTQYWQLVQLPRE